MTLTVILTQFAIDYPDSCKSNDDIAKVLKKAGVKYGANSESKGDPHS